MAQANYVFRPRKGGAVAIKLHGHVVCRAPSLDAAQAWVAAQDPNSPPTRLSAQATSAVGTGPPPSLPAGLHVGKDGRRGLYEPGTGRWTWLTESSLRAPEDPG